MDKVGYPRGLIRYTTQNALDHKSTRVLRPRIVIYAAILSTIVLMFIVGLIRRTPLDVDVIRDRNALYRMLDDGRVENVYNVKILNKTERSHRYAVTVRGAGKLALDPDPAVFSVASGEVYPVAIRVRRDAYQPLGSETIKFHVQAVDDSTLAHETDARFLAPSR
jgi:polyferredoxin